MNYKKAIVRNCGDCSCSAVEDGKAYSCILTNTAIIDSFKILDNCPLESTTIKTKKEKENRKEKLQGAIFDFMCKWNTVCLEDAGFCTEDNKALISYLKNSVDEIIKYFVL
jgi:hypothetical protein